MLFSVLLLSFIPGEFCLEFIVLYDKFEHLDPSWEISCQGDGEWDIVNPYDGLTGIFKPYWKTGDCKTLILPGGNSFVARVRRYQKFSRGGIYVCDDLDLACELFKPDSEGVKGAVYFIFEEHRNRFYFYCNTLFYFEVSSPISGSYYNVPLISSAGRMQCSGKSGETGLSLSESQVPLGSEITPEERSGIKSILISKPQDEPTEGDRYIFKVDFSGLSEPWFMAHICAKKKARKECFSDKIVVLEKDSFDNFSLSIGMSSVESDIYLQISVYEYLSQEVYFSCKEEYVFFTHRFIKKAEKELERIVFPYTSSKGFTAYLHMLHCSIDYTDCDKDGTRDVVVTIFGISKQPQEKDLLVQGVKTTVDFTCVETSHTCSATVTALLHKSTMFNYTPQKGCLGMLPPRTSSHLFKCGGIFIQIKDK